MDERTLLTAVKELHRIYDHISNTYDQLRIKALALIAGEIAVVSFIFAGDFKLPKVVYGIVFFGVGIGSLVAAFIVFLLTISSLNWAIPVEFKEIREIEKYENEAKFLEYVRKDYLEAVEHCLSVVNRRVRRFDLGLYLLLFGAIILLVIKFGGNRI
jgi:ABC-type enterobactin transport system permease subunit